MRWMNESMVWMMFVMMMMTMFVIGRNRLRQISGAGMVWLRGISRGIAWYFELGYFREAIRRAVCHFAFR